MNKNEFLRQIQTKKSLLISGILLIIGGLLIVFLTFYFTSNTKSTKLYDVVEEGTYAELEITLMDDYFATETIDGIERRYYLVGDDSYAYVAVLNADSYGALEEIRDYSMSDAEDKVKPKGVTIYGRAKVLSKEAINYLSESLPKEDGTLYTEEEIRSFVGSFYIDTFDNNDDNIAFCVIVGITCDIIGLVLIITYFIRKGKDKKSLGKYKEEIEQIANAIEKDKASFNKICKTILTDKYLISFQNGLKVIEVSNIVWIYPFEYRQRGIIVEKSIYVTTNNGKTNVLATTCAWGRKNKDAFNALYEELNNKLDNVLFGYTNENKEKAKELFRKK